jgi:hypothetical protein
MSQLESALQSLEYDDGLGNLETLQLVSFSELDPARRNIYAETGCLSSISPSDIIYAVKYLNKDQKLIEHIVSWDNTTATPVIVECGITMEEMSPTALVEYQYDPNGPWRLSRISREGLEGYIAMKFRSWRGMLDKPDCEAAFARMLKLGPINRLYDKLGFPMPESEKASWVITDEKTGKLTDIPRPVFDLRIWDPVNNSYEHISPIMGGAPGTDDELAEYWRDTLVQLRALHGDEYVTMLLNR